jgi:bifunctional DNA-binding transcriptional regulator/antitoxin component of YhaV-PrlF toxin-antitoxin module
MKFTVKKRVDKLGRIVLPKNMRETAEAIGNYKKFIYDKYNTIAKEA